MSILVPLEHDYIGLSETSFSSKQKQTQTQTPFSESESLLLLNLKATELRLGLPGLCQENPNKNKNLFSGAKRGFSDVVTCCSNEQQKQTQQLTIPHSAQDNKKESCRDPSSAAKAQVVGWPPIRSFRKNAMASNVAQSVYVKVSMDGAPYLRKLDLKTCKNYTHLSNALHKMFAFGQCTSNRLRGQEGLCESNLKELLKRDECVLTYEDKDGDWMLVGDVPWEMFVDSCKRLRIMKGSDAIGLAPRSMEKCKNQIRGI